MRNQLNKVIIELLCQYYEYKLDEYKNNKSTISFWGCFNSKLENHNHMIFLTEEHIDYFRSSESLIDFGFEDSSKVALVFVIDDDKNLEYCLNKLQNQSIIIVSKRQHKILFYSNELYETALNIQNILEHLKKSTPKSKKSVVTYGIIAINIAMFILEAYLSGNPLDIDINVLSFLGAKNNILISQGQYYRLLTAAFLHGGIVHIALNMYSLYSVGPLVEEVYGRFKYVIIYIFTGIIASLSSFLFSPNSISVGASGAIFGLLGAVLVFAFRMKDMVGKGFYRNILSVIVINIFIGFTLPNIDNFAHMGGLAAGVLLSNILFQFKSLQEK